MAQRTEEKELELMELIVPSMFDLLISYKLGEITAKQAYRLITNLKTAYECWA